MTDDINHSGSPQLNELVFSLDFFYSRSNAKPKQFCPPLAPILLNTSINISTVPIGLSRVQVVPAQSSPAFQKKLLTEAAMTTSTSNKNNNNKGAAATITTTTTTTPSGHLVKGKHRQFNILWEHNYA